MALRDGKPLHLQIEGGAGLDMLHPDVMLEAAATSFQIHLQCKPENAVRDFNASMVASAPMVAVSANSPTLFGRSLWDETRIPLFEQAVDVGGHYPKRVGFGNGFAEQSMLELFLENQENHPILMPYVNDSSPNEFSHARFHNGTIWRWNRPLIGFDHDGQVHLRIEHRVVPAGPTIRDCVANAALFYGLVRGFGLMNEPVETRMTFETARDNFYNAARYGLGARVGWNGGEIGIRELLLEELLPLARRGLASYGIPEPEIEEYLGIVEARVDSTQNGAAWQKRWIARNGMHANDLVLDYIRLQEQGRPRTYVAAVSELRQLEAVPPGLLEAEPDELLALLGGPTLLHLKAGMSGPGALAQTLFVSVLLHGNETSGWYAVQRLLRDVPTPPRELMILIGNVEAAAAGMRTLPGQQDFNRMWREPQGVARDVLRCVAKQPLLAVVDLHNNTGRNPHYSVLTDFSAGSPGAGGPVLRHGRVHRRARHGYDPGIQPANTQRCAGVGSGRRRRGRGPRLRLPLQADRPGAHP